MTRTLAAILAACLLPAVAIAQPVPAPGIPRALLGQANGVPQMDGSGKIMPTYIPTPTTSVLGGVKAAAPVSHQWLKSIGTDGGPTLAQPDVTDVTNALSTTGDASGTSSISTGSSVLRSRADRDAERINLKDYGAKGDAQGWIGAVISIGSSSLADTTATFKSSDCQSGAGCTGVIDKAITLTGSGSGGITQSGTIVGFTDSHHITVSFTAIQATPFVGALYATVGTSQSGSGSYAPGDTVTSTAATFKILDTALSSAAANATGSGGTNGACILTGTTGVQRANGASNLFTINATISGGAISAIGAIINPGDYTTNPTTLSAEPVTSNCLLTGATLTLKMGVSTNYNLFHINPGNYASLPSGAQATTTSGSGTGLTITIASPAVLGGQVTYGTDDSSALAAAINQSNTLYSSGTRSVIYVPPGNYFLKGTQIPGFTASGGLVGDAAFKSQFYIDPSYSGDVFSWSNAWLGIVGSFPTPGNTTALSLAGFGPTIEKIGIVGDRSAAAQQNAFMFYDRNDFIVMQDVNVMYLNGRSLCLACATKNGSVAYTRESRFSRLRFNQVGSSGVPVMEIGAIGAGLADDQRFSQIDIYGANGPGLVIRPSSGAAIGEIHFSQLRVEGSEYVWPQPAGDNIQIGDASYGGTVSNLYFDQVQVVSPYYGSCGIHFNGPDSAHIPYYINFTNTNIAGGVPLGCGVDIDGGRSLNLSISNISSFGTNFVMAASPMVGPPINLDMGTGENSLTYNIDSSSLDFLRTPVGKKGQPSGGLGSGSVDLQANRTAASQTASGQFSAILSGQNNTESGISSVITNGATNLGSGTYSRVGGLRISDRGRYGTDCYGSGFFLNAIGESQTCVSVMRAETTSTSATRLTTNGVSTPAAATCVSITDNYKFGVQISLVANNRTTPGNDLSWILPQGLLKRGTGAASTTWSGGTPTTLSDGTAGTVSVAADATLGCLSLSWTAPNSDTWDISARVETIENW